MKLKPLLKPLPKLYTKEEDQFIRDNFPTKTHRWMAGQLGRSIDSIKGRCRLLGLIRPTAPRKMVVAPVRTGCSQPEGLDLSTLPPHIQRWFGLVEGFEPEQGRHIAERMPDIPLSKAKYHIGSGTSAHADMSS